MRSLAVLGLILPLLGGCAARQGAVAPKSAPATGITAPPTPVPAAAGVPAAPGVPARPPAPAPLTGHVTRSALENYETWKALRAEDYTPEPAAVQAIAARGRDVDTLAVVATWCPDSKRDVPRYFKILDQAGMGLDRLTLVAVDRTKKDAEGLTERYGITRVPTFVFFRGGTEIGRVVERPATTLERDIATIVAKQ
ncbi:MAG: hypothetical protein EHM24_14255 [Acidobacteria bacterium]|nr:MAG: hypothetical protein EHM24_14255 [Acidobacteriota bacterium]